MKNILLSILLLASFHFTSAQIWNPKDVAKRKAENKVNQKMDQSIDKALDGLFSPKKKDKSTSKSESEESTETNAQPDVSGFLKGLNMGGTPKPSYAFGSSMTMKVITENAKTKEKFTMRMKYMFGKDLQTVGVKFLGSDNPEMAKASGSMDAMIMDFEQQKMFTFLNSNGQKSVMGMGFKNDPIADMAEKDSEKMTITKTGQTKTIAGYKCDGYQVKTDKDKENVIMWISQNKVGEMAQMAAKMSQGGSPFGMKASQKNYMAYNAHPELVKMAKEGRMVLGYTAVGDKGETMEMEFEDLKPSDNINFSSAGYKSMF
jgi:hypothetical protein